MASSEIVRVVLKQTMTSLMPASKFSLIVTFLVHYISIFYNKRLFLENNTLSI